MKEPYRSFFERRMRLSNGGSGNGSSQAAGGNGAGQGGAAESSGAGASAARTSPADAEQRLHVAACALLLELAHADDDFSAIERAHIEAVLRRHFALDEDTARELMGLAEAERASGDVHQFASLVRSSYDQGQKTLLAEIMWGLILSDGEIARHEATMLRKIAGLLDLEPGYLSDRRPPEDAPGR